MSTALLSVLAIAASLSVSVLVTLANYRAAKWRKETNEERNTAQNVHERFREVRELLDAAMQDRADCRKEVQRLYTYIDFLKTVYPSEKPHQ